VNHPDARRHNLQPVRVTPHSDDERDAMTEYAYDPELIPYIAELPTVQDFSTVEKIQALRAMRAEMLVVAPDRDDVRKVDRSIPGLSGDPEVTVRIYSPTADPERVRPAILEIHGGGFLLGDIEMMDAWCQMIAARVDAVVVSVEYRLAPEHPFPAAVHDSYAALLWVAENAASLKVDPERIAIAGQSAGGGIAAGTALLARDEGGPKLCYQLLEIPEIDDRLDTPSMHAFLDTPFWNRPNAIASWKHYLGPELGSELGPEPGPERRSEPSIYAAPARAKDLSGLPPAYVSTMEFDPLRDEGIRYALALLEAGISVELHSYAGTFHGSAFMPGAEPSLRNTEEIVTLLTRRLHP
jgi:acetyl esterase/lipase